MAINPDVAPTTRAFVADAGLRGQVDVRTADVLAEPLEGGFDVAIARAFFQALSEEDARAAVKHVAAGIGEGGHLVVIGFVSDDSRLAPDVAVGMNLVFINRYDDGQVYTEAQYRDWMAAAGLCDVMRQPFLAGNSLMTARKARS